MQLGKLFGYGNKGSYNDPQTLYYNITGNDLNSVMSHVNDPGFPGVDDERPYQKVFEYGGDHVYVESLDANMEWSIRLGTRRNPPIRLRPGMVINRPFNRVTILGQNQAGGMNLQVDRLGSLWPSSFSIFLSTGPLVLDPGHRTYGYGPRSIGGCDFTASTTPEYITAAYQNPTDLQPHHPGRHGASLMLRNVDNFNDLFLVGMQDSQNPGNFTELWRLRPGDVHCFPLDGSIVGFDGRKIGLGIKTRAGTCKFDWFLSCVSPDSPPSDFGMFGTSTPQK